MAILQVVALAVQCNVCSEQCVPVKLDRLRYTYPGHEAYTNRLNERAFLLAKEEGFVLIENAANVTASKHICGNCVKLFSGKIDKPAKPSKSGKLSKKALG